MKYLFGKLSSWLLVLSIVVFNISSGQAQSSIRNANLYNLNSGIGLKGYDPVAYFPEGGASPQKGIERFKLDYMGVMYLFSSAKNLDLFVENPDKYEPTYGGWCAFAMASGTYVDIQPTIYTIQGNRIHFFVGKRAKNNFDADIVTFEMNADRFWKQISGESPRL